MKNLEKNVNEESCTCGCKDSDCTCNDKCICDCGDHCTCDETCECGCQENESE